MNIERVKRVADFVGNSGGEQSQSVQSLGLDRLLLGAPTFSNVAQNNRVSDPLACSRGRGPRRIGDSVPGCRILTLNHERDTIKINESVSGIENLHVAADCGFA